jgi:hypothetical protein
MNSSTKNERQYQRAFVIQFRTETDFVARRCAGRVEHVASYEATHFHSLDELLAFMARLLREAQDNHEEKES